MIFDPNMTSVKPYMVRALYDWIVDNGLTPLIVLDAEYEGIRVPPGVVENKKIVLNVSIDAVENFIMDNELITFSARFSGVSHAIIVPIGAITAVYTRENGKGMMFEVERADYDYEQDDNEADSRPEIAKKNKKSHLKLVD